MEERRKLETAKPDLDGTQTKQTPAKSDEDEQKDLSTDEFINLFKSEQNKARKFG